MTPRIESKECINESDYPFTWTDLSDEEKKERKKIYTAEGPWCVSPKASMLDLIVSRLASSLLYFRLKKIKQ